MVFGENLQQESLGLYLHPVYFINQQDDRLFGPDGLQQWPGEKELLGEEVLFDVRPAGAVALGLDAQ